MVPFLTPNSYLQALQRHRERDEINPRLVASQRIQRTPLVQRKPATKSRQTDSSEKYRIAFTRFSGNFFSRAADTIVP